MPKVVLCVKQVIASDAKLKLDGNQVSEADVEFQSNAYDDFAVEEGIRIVEKLGGEVTALTLGPDRADKMLRDIFAKGVKSGYRVWGPEFQGGDILATARALAAAVQKIGFDLVLCGKQAIDQDNHSFGPMLAEFLGVPHVTAVVALELNADGTGIAKREIEGGTEVITFSLPAVISTDKGLNEPRYAKIQGVMAAKKVQIQNWSASDLGLSVGQVGAAGSGSRQLTAEFPPARTAGKLISGDAATQAKELVRLLRDEAKAL